MTKSTPRAYLQFRIVYALLAANFILPAISYAANPALALRTLHVLNVALGGGAIVETGHVWHMLAVGNVMTLGFMCALMAVDLRRYYPVLPALAFLKGFSAVYSLFLGATEHVPVFFLVFLLDGATTAAMIFFARRAHRALREAAPT
jgi:hypothetical protein